MTNTVFDLAQPHRRTAVVVIGGNPADGKSPSKAMLGRPAIQDCCLNLVGSYTLTDHTTASDSPWSGLPIVTMLGSTFPGRAAASVLHAAGLPQLVTRKLAEYASLAFRLSTDPAALSELRRELDANRNTCAFFDTHRFRRHLEHAFEVTWEIWRRGEPPTSFRVEA